MLYKSNLLKFSSVLSLIVLAAAMADAGALRLDFTPSFAEKFGQKAPPQKTYTVKPCSSPPAIDGKLDDECWKGLEAFELTGGKPVTKVRACYDDKNIYLAFECGVNENQPPKAQTRERDTDAWKDDAIEICVGSPTSRNFWYHFIVSATNSVYDQKMSGTSTMGAYNPEYSHQTRIGEKEWIVEVALPRKALELEQWPARLGFNVGRDGPSIGPRFWTNTRRDTDIAAFFFEGIKDATDVAGQDANFITNQHVSGKSLGIFVDRTYARPGERWIEVECNIKPEKASLEKTRIEAKIFGGVDYSELKDSLSIVPTRNKGRLEIDLRSLKLKQAKIQVKVVEENQATGFGEFVLTNQPCQVPFETGRKVEVKIDTPAGLDKKAAYPVTFGVPLPAGAIWDIAGLRLVDKNGKILPYQKEQIGLWAPEGSVKWVRFDALAIPDNGCFVEMSGKDGHDSAWPSNREGRASSRPSGYLQELKLTEKDGKIEIDTGAAKYVLAKGISPVEQVWLGNKLAATRAGTRGLYLVDQKGRLASATADEESMGVEASGPVSACVRFEGWYATADGKRLARHVTRVECFAGEAAATITHSFVITEDTNETWFKEIGWEFALTDKTAARAIFATNRENPDKYHEVKLEDGRKSAYMLQDSHYYFGHGTNHFEIGVVDNDGKTNIVFEGGAASKKAAESPIVPTPREVGTTGEEECGDYAALIGKEAGLSLICRDTARQHPKEFETNPGKINIKLFSNRAGLSPSLVRPGSPQVKGGEELDFRTKTLIKKWDLVNWHKHAPGAYRDKDIEKELDNYVSNAQGWSKTHLIKIVPLAGDAQLNAVKRETLKLKHPVFGLADPKWLYATRAMGPLYPQDRERFPEAEEMASAYAQKLLEYDTTWGENGFVDYAAGPEFHYYYGAMWPDLARNGMTYALRPGLWMMYARSGDRALREFTEDTNRTWIDCRHGQWDTPVCRKGMLRWSASLPFYWVPNSMMDYVNTASLNQLAWHYYLTGYRRAADTIRDYAANVKKIWTPKAALHPTHPACVLYNLAQCYGFTLDRQIRDLAGATMDLLEDPESSVGFSKYANAESTTSKQQVLVRGYIEDWELIGETRYYRMAKTFADLMNRRRDKDAPLGYVNSRGVHGAFSYDDTRDPRLAESLLCQVRWAAACYRPEINDFSEKGYTCAAASTFITDLGYALHVIAQADADRQPLVSWLAYSDMGDPTAIFLQKPENGKVNINYHAPGMVEGEKPFTAVNSGSDIGMDTFSITTEASEDIMGTISFPKDMIGCTYRMAFAGIGPRWFFADCRVPFVFYAPGYWNPIPIQKPAVKYFFRLQPANKDAQIYFEGLTRLLDPSGKTHPTNGAARGWIDLPSEKAGLWAFEPVEFKLVKTRNLPPFFAVRDPESHFVPDVPWEREGKPEPMEIPTNGMFGAGAIAKTGNQALYLVGTRTLQITPGPDRADGDGGAFLPMREGTIEFLMRPAWSSAELPDQTKRILFAPLKTKAQGGSDFLLSDYRLAARDKTLNFSLNTTYENSELDKGIMAIQIHRAPTFFEKGKWVHVAYVWGHRDNIKYSHPGRYVPHDRANNVGTAEIYINGRMGGFYRTNSGKNSCPVGPMIYLSVGLIHQGLTNLDMAVDELRISDFQRYRQDFTPPGRDEELKADEHTRALFHFNGSLEGERWGEGEKPVGKVNN